MRTVFLLGIALITYLLGNSFTINPPITDQEKHTGKITDPIWEELHWMIERSSVDTVKANFLKFVNSIRVKTNASKCQNGKFIGITPLDDYGYFHLAVVTINKGKIIDIHYDELKMNGDNKRADVNYNREMVKSGTSPSIAYPIYESQLINKQDYMNIDAVTGATYSLYRFRMAVAKALEKASQE